jgi:hypothetical protein
VTNLRRQSGAIGVKRTRRSTSSGQRCRPCERDATKTYRETLNGFLQSLVGMSRGRTKRIKTEAKKGTAVHAITKEDLVEIYKKQDGKCYYSSIPMKNSHHSSWMLSIERLNEAVGYTKENTVLCCH